jgi:shikimate kinase
MTERGFVVYLRAPVAVLAQRVGTGTGRPWLDDDAESAFARLEAGRDARYLELADLVLDVPGHTPDELARRIVDAVAG